MTLQFWRKWHRWIGFPASLFLLFASCTCHPGLHRVLWRRRGPCEATRPRQPCDAGLAAERLVRSAARADHCIGVSGRPPSTRSPCSSRATSRRSRSSQATGRRRRQAIRGRLKTGALIRTDAYVDKPFLNRLHSGEAFGDAVRLRDVLGACAVRPDGDGADHLPQARPRTTVGIQKVFW